MYTGSETGRCEARLDASVRRGMRLQGVDLRGDRRAPFQQQSDLRSGHEG